MLDPVMQVDRTTAAHILFVGDAEQTERQTEEWMAGIDDRDRFSGRKRRF